MYAHDGRLHLHQPFLDRLTDHKPDAPCALAAFLLLNVIDGLRHPEFDADTVNLRINAVYNPLGRAPSGDPQVLHLLRIAERLRKVAQTRDVGSVASDVIGYANWLATESRFNDALSVLNTGNQVLMGLQERARAAVLLRKGFNLTCTGHLQAAADAYRDGVEIAERHRDEVTQLLCSIGLAKVWRLQGRSTESRRLFLSIKRRATDRELADIIAIVCHDIGADPNAPAGTSLPLLTEAYHAYGELHRKKRALADIGYLLVKVGCFSHALKCIEAVRRHDEGGAFRASVLGTLLWIASQRADRSLFAMLLREYEDIDEGLALTTEADIKLRIGQCFLVFADYGRANQYLHEALELSDKFVDPSTALAAKTSIDVVRGNASIRAIQIEQCTTSAGAVNLPDDNGRLAAIFRDIDC